MPRNRVSDGEWLRKTCDLLTNSEKAISSSDRLIAELNQVLIRDLKVEADGVEPPVCRPDDKGY